jgi:DNA-binding LytR/AlgR family response regulator
MPVMSGFEVVQNLSEPPLPIIIIVTAFDQHAIEAFEAGAVDYLLKPASRERLRTTVERAQYLLGKPGEIVARAEKVASSAQRPGVAAASRKIVGRAGDEYLVASAGYIRSA